MHQGERFNSISHLIGAVLALIGTTALLLVAASQSSTVKIACFSIYGALLFFLYLNSTLYHSFRGKAKRLFHRLDHAGVYLLIAGTYTPFALIPLRTRGGVWLLAAVWTLALIGILHAVFLHGKFRAFPATLSLVAGWLIVFSLEPLIAAISPAGIAWLAIGGALYTIGVVFYALSGRWRLAHPLWHLFVLFGSAAHYVSIMWFVALA